MHATIALAAIAKKKHVYCQKPLAHTVAEARQMKLAAREAEYKARFANPFVAGARGFIDDVILPHETRKRICRSLVMLRDKKLENPWRKHGNIPL
mgnify:CR=1 FL=1